MIARLVGISTIAVAIALAGAASFGAQPDDRVAIILECGLSDVKPIWKRAAQIDLEKRNSFRIEDPENFPTVTEALDFELTLANSQKTNARERDESHLNWLNTLGVYYSLETFERHSDSRAAHYLEQAASAGYAPAQTNLGRWYSQSELGDKRSRARELLYDAATQCHPRGITIVAHSLLGDSPSIEAYASTAVLYRKAYELGYGPAANGIAGIAVETDFEVVNGAEAFRYLEDAVEKGVKGARLNMGIMLRDGLGIAADPAYSATIFRDAVRNGDVRAAHELAMAFEFGNGVPKNMDSALELYQIGAERGLPNSMYAIGKIHLDGKDVEPDYEKAHHWLQKSADTGFEPAKYYLAIMYLEGMGVDKDREHAIELLEQIKNSGDGVAARLLDRLAGE